MQEYVPHLIAIDRLYNNPYQPRSAMDEESLQQLADTIQSQGFQGSLVVRPHPQIPGIYELTAGHRRRDAARRAGIQGLPVVVRAYSNREMITFAVTENIQREDLTALEEGKLFQRMIDEMELSEANVAESIKKDRMYVHNRILLAQAPADIQEFTSSGANTTRAAIHLLKIADPAERAPVIQQLVDGTLAIKDLPAHIEALQGQQTAETHETEQTSQQHSINTIPSTIVQSTSNSTVQEVRANETTIQDSHVAETEQDAGEQAAKPASTKKSVDAALTLARAQTSKLKLVCKRMEDFELWLREQHIAMSDVEREMLMSLESLVQYVLQTY